MTTTDFHSAGSLSANSPRVIFFDIDGTLVSFKTHQIPQSTLDAVHRVRQQGVKVWIATGRPLPYINNLGALEYDGIMSVNGAHCQTREGHVIYSNPIDKADVQRMIAEQEQSGRVVTYACNDRAIVVAPKGIPAEAQEVFDLLNLGNQKLSKPEDVIDANVMQVIAFFGTAERQRIMGEVLQNCNETRWHPAFADCVARGTDKATGIGHVLRYYGFGLSDAMAFGDGGNDISMLQHVGTGIAMGNASDEVKAAADIVTTSVDDDGIAEILNKIE